METYMIITNRFNENGIDEYFAISKDRIETMKASETYDRFGQLVDEVDAGDYVCLLTQKAVDLANKIANEEREENHNNSDSDEEFEKNEIYSLNDTVSAYDNRDIFTAIRELDETDFDHISEEVKGFNYWDGNNWKTVTIECEYNEPSHEVIEEKLSVEINEAIENVEFTHSGFGVQVGKYNDWVVISSQWQGDFSAYTVMSREDYYPVAENSSALPSL